MGLSYICNHNAFAASSACAKKPFVSGLWFPLVRLTIFFTVKLPLAWIVWGGRKFLCNLCSSSMWFWGARPRHALKWNKNFKPLNPNPSDYNAFDECTVQTLGTCVVTQSSLVHTSWCFQCRPSGGRRHSQSGSLMERGGPCRGRQAVLRHCERTGSPPPPVVGQSHADKALSGSPGPEWLGWLVESPSAKPEDDYSGI